MKAAIDAGVSNLDILKTYKDPHLYSSIMKHYLRELPDPLFCSSFALDWKSLTSIENEEEKQRAIVEMLEKLPPANKINISFIFGFLSKLEKEKEHAGSDAKAPADTMSPVLSSIIM